MKIDGKSCLRLGLTAFALFLAVRYWDAAAGLMRAAIGAAGALLTGCVIAYVLNILMSFYEKHYFPGSRDGLVRKSRRAVCMPAAMVTLVGVVVLIVRLVLPELWACVQLLLAEVPRAIENALAWVESSGILSDEGAAELLTTLQGVNWQEKLTQAAKLLLEGVGGAAQAAVTTLSAAAGLVMNLVIGAIFAIYLLAGKERLSGQFSRVMKRYLPEAWDCRVRYVLGVLDDCFHKFIVGQCTEAVVLGVLCMAGMTLLRFPYAVMIGTLVGFTALIPVAGAYIGAAVGAFMILTVDPVKAVAFLVFIVVLQQLEGNLIYPRVVGTSIGLPGVWVLATVTVAGGILGVGGMLIGVPVAAAVYRLVREDVARGMQNEERRMQDETTEGE